ncbi:hypothetical protein HYT84_03595 [Candidatus Micrarchaeota archaeon]|nr:hypothetical protein [Candidatus Micrarchaeota archaeon]
MKIKLTPEFAYIIGFWRKRRSREGLGIHGENPHLELFSKEVLDKKLTSSEKLLSEEGKVYFYHTAYRKFFQEIEEEQLERFKYLNEYAASYLAGLFDSIGGVDEKGFVFINKTNKQDEILLLRLGFTTRKSREGLIIGKPRAFLALIKNYVKLHNNNRAFEYVKS